MSSSTPELGNIILRAGAGAGKTTTLTHLFLDYACSFKEHQKKFPRVVITTFTRKATQELKERLLKLSLEKGRQDLFHYITNKSQVQISTIHGVLSLFLARHGSQMGLSADFRLLSSSQEASMRRKILRRLILADGTYEPLLESYTFQHLETSLQKYFENTFLHPDLRYIRKEEFAQELKTHLSSLESERREVSASILSEAKQASWIKYAEGLQGFSLKSSDENLENTLAGMANFFSENARKPSYSAKNPAVSAENAERLGQLIEALKDLQNAPQWTLAYWDEHELKNGLFETLAKTYSEDLFSQKIEAGSISMSDLELFSLRLIRDFPEACESFSNEWDYWMIDEYQDTSPIQVELLKNLVGAQKSFVVGDPQQSIYLFRGARSEVFQEKVNQVGLAGGNVQQKLVNYRSEPRLLHFINHYFVQGAGGGSAQFAKMEPAPNKQISALEVPVAQLRIVEKNETLSGLSEETQATLQRIQELLATGISAEQICVLSRTRDGLEKLAKAAEAYGVPVQIHIAGGFYQRREVRDTLGLLKFLINPHDNVNFLATIRSPWLQVSDQEILTYCHSGAHSFWVQARNSVPDSDERHPVNLLKKYLALSQGMGFCSVLRRMLIELGLLDSVQSLDATGRREANLWKLVANLFEHERSAGANFLDFLEGLNESPDLETGNDDSDATPVIAPQRVNLMTVHGSKGLQFEHVLVLGMSKKPRLSHSELFTIEEATGRWSLSLMNEEERKIQPSALALSVKEQFNQRELNEHARVLYVALTRAKSGLTLIFEGKAEKNSWASTCPLVTTAGKHTEADFSYDVLEGTFVPDIQERSAVAMATDPGAWKTGADAKNLQTIAVTKMIESENQSASNSSPMPPQYLQKALAKAYRGTEAHRIFESLKYTPAAKVIEHLDDEQLKAAVRFVTETKEIPLLKIIEHGHAEWGFSFREKELWINGQIDLWGVVDGEAWLVDYKTGSSEYSDVAFEQLKAYAWALQRMKFVKPAQKVHLAVVYPFEKKIKTELNYQIDPEKYLQAIWEK
ncbi:MAG: UvrD-helicase domain-containing protein [Bdellovibrionaceae bacterium]|nr:UvrD-helicase domain-containing protein [Pseudobdellovibrionaceae bacterium]